MRYITFFLIILVNIITVSAWAKNVLLGTVVSIDRGKGEMIVRLNDPRYFFSEGSRQEEETAPETITVYFLPDRLPENIKKGKLVRLWGSIEPNVYLKFKATYIRNVSRKVGYDPTGVRSRIGIGRKMGKYINYRGKKRKGN